MNDSFQLDLFSETFTNTVTITSDTHVFHTDTMLGDISLDDTVISIDCSADTAITTDYIDYNFQDLQFPKEWINKFPDFYKIKSMSKEYPSLEIAIRNFQTIYELVKDDYENKTKDS